MFEPNDKVVCIDDQFLPFIKRLYKALPSKGRTYVVRDVLMGFEPVSRKGERPKGAVRLLLVGLVNPPATGTTMERGFNAERFRKLDEIREQSKQGASKTNTRRKGDLVPA